MKHEQTIRSYFDGWKRNDWSAVERLLAEDFTFTSLNDDDHIDKRRYQEKCWPGAASLERMEIDTIVEKDDEAFIRYRGRFAGGEDVHNMESFRLANGKIKEIEVFFGRP